MDERIKFVFDRSYWQRVNIKECAGETLVIFINKDDVYNITTLSSDAEGIVKVNVLA